MSLSVPAAQLLALFLGSFLHGTFFTLFVILLLLSTQSIFPNPFHRNILAPVACVMMALSTVHIVLSFVRAIQAFTGKVSPTIYYTNFRHPLQTAKACVFIAQTLLGDAIMIWRCYILYDKSKIVILLSLLPLGSNLVFGVLGTKDYVSHTSEDEVNKAWLSAYTAMTLLVNVFCSAAIIRKIYRVTSDTQSFRKAFPIIGAVVKSGSLYATGTLALLITYFVRCNGVYPILDTVVPLVGIVFALMVLQIYIHLTYSSRSICDRTATLPTLGTLPRWRRYFTSPTESQQYHQHQSITDPRVLLQPAPIYSRQNFDIDRVSLASEIDTRSKAG